MKTQTNFKSYLTKLSGQMLKLGYHSVVTLPSRYRLHRTLTIILLLLCIGVGNVWGEEIYKNEGAAGTSNGITATGNVNTNSSNGNPGNSFANTSNSNTTFTFTGFDVSNYENLELSIDAKFASFPSTTNTWPYVTITFSKNEVSVLTDNTTIKWTSKGSTYSTYILEDIPDFDKITIECSPASGTSAKGKPTTSYATYMDNITLSGDPLPSCTALGQINGSIIFINVLWV